MKSSVRINLDQVYANDFELTFSNSIEYKYDGAPLTKAELDAVWVGLCDSLYKRLCSKIQEQDQRKDPSRIIEHLPYDFGDEKNEVPL